MVLFVLCHGVCVITFIAWLKVVIIMKYLSIIGTGDKPWIYLGLQVPVFLHLVSLTREKLSKKCQWPHLRSRTASCLFLTSSDIQKTSLNPCGERTTPLTDLNGDKKKYFLKLLRLRSNLSKKEKCPLLNETPELWILYDRGILHKR